MIYQLPNLSRRVTVRKVKIKNKEKPLAIVTGGINGNLGPLWVEYLREAGYRTWTIDLPQYDVSKLSDIQFARDRCLAIMGVPKVIINNAAIDPKPIEGEGCFWNYDKIIDVNLKGAINVCKEFIPHMVTNGGGVIINIGSIMGTRGAVKRNYPNGFDKAIGYNVSKAALIQLSRSITTQFGDKNIRSVTIGFGPCDMGLPEEFKTKFLRDVPLNRCISKESLKATLLYAISCPEFAGQLVLVDAGFCS